MASPAADPASETMASPAASGTVPLLLSPELMTALSVESSARAILCELLFVPDDATGTMISKIWQRMSPPEGDHTHWLANPHRRTAIVDLLRACVRKVEGTFTLCKLGPPPPIVQTCIDRTRQLALEIEAVDTGPTFTPLLLHMMTGKYGRDGYDYGWFVRTMFGGLCWFAPSEPTKKAKMEVALGMMTKLGWIEDEDSRKFVADAFRQGLTSEHRQANLPRIQKLVKELDAMGAAARL
jgi:hypothetical protein